MTHRLGKTFADKIYMTRVGWKNINRMTLHGGYKKKTVSSPHWGNHGYIVQIHYDNDLFQLQHIIDQPFAFGFLKPVKGGRMDNFTVGIIGFFSVDDSVFPLEEDGPELN